MSKTSELTNQQKQQIGYTEWENIVRGAYRMVFFSVVAAISSFLFLGPIIGILDPGSTAGSPPRTVIITFGIFILCLIFGIACMITACAGGIALWLSHDSINHYRLKPLIVNSWILLFTIPMILFSCFVDYGWWRVYIVIILTIVATISFIATYCVYCARYRRTVRALIETTGQPGTE